MRDLSKKKLFKKTTGTFIYKWSPQDGNKLTTSGGNPYFCNATVGSQGEDWVTTYDYNVIVIAGLKKRIAYVACGYVE